MTTTNPTGPHEQSPSTTGNGTDVTLARPAIADGSAMWQIAADSQVLDVNSMYAYVLWCRDFAATSAIATDAEGPLGFVTGYRRPGEPDVLMVWQVAVNERARGRGVAGKLLDHTVAGHEDVRFLETTITPDNEPSRKLFSRFAAARGAGIQESVLFDTHALGGEHMAEHLFRIGPL